MLARLKDLVRPLYHRLVPPPADPLSTAAALGRCRQWLPDGIATVIDIGASDGRWSVAAKGSFPDARCLMIEAQTVHEPALKALTAGRDDLRYVLAAAGDREGTVTFDASDPFGGVADPPPGSPTVTVPMTTVDAAVRAAGFPPPYLLKLDTHGFEVPIFEGAADTLRDTALIVVETYNFTLSTPTALRFPDLCRYLEGKGFRCCDLIEPMFRPRDGAFWQVDLAFVPTRRLPLSTADAGGFT